jgi:hypothetical protein
MQLAPAVPLPTALPRHPQYIARYSYSLAAVVPSLADCQTFLHAHQLILPLAAVLDSRALRLRYVQLPVHPSQKLCRLAVCIQSITLLKLYLKPRAAHVCVALSLASAHTPLKYVQQGFSRNVFAVRGPIR